MCFTLQIYEKKAINHFAPQGHWRDISCLQDVRFMKRDSMLNLFGFYRCKYNKT